MLYSILIDIETVIHFYRRNASTYSQLIYLLHQKVIREVTKCLISASLVSSFFS